MGSAGAAPAFSAGAVSLQKALQQGNLTRGSARPWPATGGDQARRQGHAALLPPLASERRLESTSGNGAFVGAQWANAGSPTLGAGSAFGFASGPSHGRVTGLTLLGERRRGLLGGMAALGGPAY